MPIQLDDATFGYGRRPVVRAGSIRLHPGRCLGIYGPNGSGKTTLVRGLMGLLPPQAGRVTIPAGLGIGYVPQHRGLELHWPMTGFDAAAMAISAQGRLGWVRGGATRVRASMAALEVADLERRPFANLSGGQQQRLLLAGALATDPAVLILDEPTEGLDRRSRTLLLQAVKLHMERGLSAVLISHDVQDLLALAVEIACLFPAADADTPSEVEVVRVSSLIERITREDATL